MKYFIKLYWNFIFYKINFKLERVQKEYQNKIIDYEFVPRKINWFMLILLCLPTILVLEGLFGFVDAIMSMFNFKNAKQYQTQSSSAYRMVLYIHEKKDDWFWIKYCYRNK